MDKNIEIKVMLIAILISSIICASTIQKTYAETNYNVTIKVVDAYGKPIENSNIYIYRYVTPYTISFYTKTKLEYGLKTLKLPQGTYIIYARADLIETPTIDYTIGYVNVNVEGDLNITITLIKAAEVKVIGESLDARSESKGKIMGYTIYSTQKLEVNGTKILQSFGEREKNIALDIESDKIIVPANFEVTVEVEVLYTAGRYVYTKYYNLTKNPIKLLEGEIVIFEIQEITLKDSILDAKQEYNKTISNIEKAEKDGFYLAIYKSKISNIINLIENGEVALRIKRYDECYSNIREAILALNEINNKVTQLYSEATSSTTIIIILLTLTSTIIGLTIFDRERYSLIASAVSFIILVYVFKTLYPGINAIDQNLMYIYAATSYIIITILTITINHMGEKGEASLRSLITSISSISKRNLKRRKLRSILTIMSITIIIGGFVALTSASVEEGLRINVFNRVNEPEGIIVYRSVGEERYSKFTAISTTIIDAYSIEEKSREYSFKLESQAKFAPLEIAINPYVQDKLNIYGAIAFTNPSDPMIQRINMKIKGRLPNKSGEIAVTNEAAKKLNINIGDKIILLNSGKRMEVTGILSDDFISIVDYDDRSLTPGKLIMVMGGEEVRIELMDCESIETVIVSPEDSRIFSLLPARLYIRIINEEDAFSLSKRIALSGIYMVKTITQNKIYLLNYQSYMDIKGLEAMLTLAICISNIGIVMLASVHERKNEVTILSAIGLNPSHITAIFAFEAIIIGLIAGGIGYIIGLTFYKIAYNLNLTIEVYPKVSYSWAISTLIISAITAASGSIPALRSSIIVTPSKLMRWKADKKPQDLDKPWEFIIPIRFGIEEIGELLTYLMESLNNTMGVERMRRIDDRTIRFSYRIGQGTIGSSGSINKIQIYMEEEPKIKLEVIPYGEDVEKHAYEVAKLVRSIVIKWRSEKA
ncbi:MAG: FtsX-like permease family protein [Candidatus Methanomethylicia archaeon]